MIFNFNLLLVFLEVLYFKKYKGKVKVTIGSKHKAVLLFENKGELFFLFLTFLQLATLLCLRAETVGVDTQTYLYIYRCGLNGLSGLSNSHVEKGAQLYIWLLSRWGENDILFLSAFAIPTIILNYRFIWKYSNDVYMSVFMFTGFMYYFLVFNMMRQSLAMAIALQALQPAMEKKWGKFVFVVALAAIFHKSAWIFLVLAVIPFLKIKINAGYFIGAIVGSVLILCTGKKIIRGVLDFLGSSYVHYLDNAHFGKNGNIFHPLMYFLILFLMVLLWKNGIKEKNTIFIHMILIGTMLYTLSILVKIANRLPYYFTIAVIVLLPNLVGKIRNRTTYILITGCVYFCIAMYEIIMVARNAQGVLPYAFFWEK